MNRALSRPRRFAVVFVSLVLAAVLFRSQVAAAIVIRGDDLAIKGEQSAALAYYRRAFRLDPDSSLAADRYVFTLLERHSPGALQSAISSAIDFLEHNPNDEVVLEDRAMCYLRARKYESALRDFERAARLSQNPRLYVFAGWTALHAGRERDARVLWNRALAVDSDFTPAKRALEEHAK